MQIKTGSTMSYRKLKFIRKFIAFIATFTNMIFNVNLSEELYQFFFSFSIYLKNEHGHELETKEINIKFCLSFMLMSQHNNYISSMIVLFGIVILCPSRQKYHILRSFVMY